jgi:uncharacterized protein HemX
MFSFGLSSIAIKIGIALLAGAAALGGGWFAYGAVYARGFDAASAQYQNVSLQAALAETQKQLRDAQEVIAEDRALAEQLATENAALKEKTDATPPNDAACLDAGAASRIDGVR